MNTTYKEDWASSVLLFISVLMALIQLWFNLVLAGIASSVYLPGLMLQIALLVFGPAALGLGAMRRIRHLKLRLIALIVGTLVIVGDLGYTVIGLNQPEPTLVAQSPAAIPTAIALVIVTGTLIASYQKARQLIRPNGD